MVSVSLAVCSEPSCGWNTVVSRVHFLAWRSGAFQDHHTVAHDRLVAVVRAGSGMSGKVYRCDNTATALIEVWIAKEAHRFVCLFSSLFLIEKKEEDLQCRDK